MEPGDTELDALDAAQRTAVLHAGGPLLLVAGAGSGKTRAVVARIVRLIRRGVPPDRVLGITFTNRAADEMRERVAAALGAPGPAAGGPPGLPPLCTFHAFGAGLLRRFARRIGLPPGFLIYDARDQLVVIRQILKDMNVDEKRFPAGRFAARIERAKRDGDREAPGSPAEEWAFGGKAAAVRRAYDEALAAAGAVDFADLIRLPVLLFREHPDVLEAVRGEIRHLLVDEFQDVDRGQAELSRGIALGAESFLAVGDEDQSIYGWRGGSAGPMLSFERDYPGAAVVHLATNYRSRASILAAAGEVIRRNQRRREKRILAARAGGEPPAVRSYADADAEAAGVALLAAEEARRGVRRSAIAVFYRVNAQSRPVEDALRRAAIPYVLRGALSFYDRASVRDALAYLRWFLNPDDPVSLARLLKAPRRGVGEAALLRAREAARAGGTPYSAGLATVPALAPLLSLRDRWVRALPGRGVGDALRTLLDGAGYLAWIGEEAGSPREESGEERRDDRRENVEELLRMAAAFPGTGEEAARDFLERISLSPPEEEEGGADAVRLMTMHNAKGLEFETVFLVGLEEGLLPHSRSSDSESGVEEERRLFYVGLTRARERVFLSYARRRLLFGSHRDSARSRFLSEIPSSLLRREGEGEAPGPARGWSAAGGPASGGGSPPRPRRVRHPLFGEGVVESEEGAGEDRKITARFPGYGRKKILVRAARMEMLD
jgi:DNA helicase II / ATP-dependent DNA helicase PcrA